MSATPTIKTSPIAGLSAKDLHDSFNQIHHGHRHEAIDIMETPGTPVRSVIDELSENLFQ